jgi:hypothetical protein
MLWKVTIVFSVLSSLIKTNMLTGILKNVIEWDMLKADLLQFAIARKNNVNQQMCFFNCMRNSTIFMVVYCMMFFTANEMGNVSSFETDEPIQETVGLVCYAVLFHSVFINSFAKHVSSD